jgi:hypothetical protein
MKFPTTINGNQLTYDDGHTITVTVREAVVIDPRTHACGFQLTYAIDCPLGHSTTATGRVRRPFDRICQVTKRCCRGNEYVIPTERPELFSRLSDVAGVDQPTPFAITCETDW